MVLEIVREAEAVSSLPGLRIAASITLSIIQAMKDNESDFYRLAKDLVDHITIIHQACKKLEAPEGQLGVQFHKALDTFVKILESIEVCVGRGVGRNTSRVMNSSPADGAKVQEYRNKLARITRHLELELHIQSLLQSIEAIRCGADWTEGAALIQPNGDDDRSDAAEDGYGGNCQKCASSKSPEKKAESSTKESKHERVVPLSSSSKPRVESESEIHVGETTEEERARGAAKREGKKKANQTTTENEKDIPYSQPSTFDNHPFALHGFPMPNFPPYYFPPYHPWLYYQSQAMWTIPPPPSFFGASMPSINTYWTHNVNSNNFTRTAVNNSGNDHSTQRTNW